MPEIPPLPKLPLNPRSCRNRCVFCFVDQQPPGLREPLYFKDDDYRLSYLAATYVTLTNLSERDCSCVIGHRLSPLRVSVQAADADVRGKLLGRPNADVMPRLEYFIARGIEIHAQLVICPGLNDGAELENSLKRLDALGEGLLSVSVVPVGLTKHREGLYPLRTLTRDEARDCIERAGRYRRAYCSDEMFILAGFDFPPDEYYGDYPQYENGVGMARTFIDAFDPENFPRDGILVTGEAFYPTLSKLVPNAFRVLNDFWGRSVTVAGLLTARDVIAQIAGTAGKVYLPPAMFNAGGVTLDGMSASEIADAAGREISVLKGDF